MGIGQPVQLHHGDVAAPAPLLLRGEFQRQTRLADPTRTGQRQQTHTVQQPSQLGHLLGTADEAAQLRQRSAIRPGDHPAGLPPLTVRALTAGV
ncbi:hypothetical protein [Streptomyces pseudovenezuelae]|uniref:Uncharacterized protein n=1 Tax=Streptomyces pseudovenezuelae TaxID=67350 RepID=A0ABT6LZ20_9ACTN|nr:hypothetical protein [Streptomyces pseudovenezuelae]